MGAQNCSVFERFPLEAFAFHPLAQQLAVTTNRFRLLSSLALGRLLIRPTELHFPEYALTLHFLFQRFQGLVDIIVAYVDVNDGPSPWQP